MKFNLKKVIASVAALAMSLSCFTAFAADFTDVEATASYKNAIDTLVALEIVNGYGDGSFKPDNEITRAEVTKMVVAAMGPSYTAAAESSVGTADFTDVKGHWAAGYISVGVAQNFINGMGDGTFAPDANVTYAQIVKMLVAALGYTSAADLAGGYPNGYLSQGNTLGITDGLGNVAADTKVTRAQVAQLIANSLDIPLVLVTNWTTNQFTGEPLAEIKVMDGEEGRAYKTLLTEYHDAYVVKGRVTNTKTTDSTLKAGTVEFRVELADNFDKVSYKAVADTTEVGGDGLKDSSVAYINPLYGATDAEDLLFTYAEAIIKVNEDDDYEIAAIIPYGKNEIVEVASDDFDTFTSGTPDTISFFEANSSSKSKAYKLDSSATLYVNGKVVGSVASYYGTYISGNEIGTVTLIDTPAAATTSKDGKFDYVMVTYKKWAVVEETISSGDINKIVFSDFDTNVGAYINMDTTDEEAIYTFYKNGEEVTFEDIAADDVALLTYDVVTYSSNANAAKIITFELCDTVVEGKVTAKSSDGDYTVGGEKYQLLTGLSALTVGNEYSLKLDAAGRVIVADKLSSTTNYGIIDRVYGNSEGDYLARIIKADGTRESITLKKQISIDGTDSKTAKDLFNATYASASLTSDADIKNATNGLKALTARIITYKINSSDEISEVNFIGGTTTGSVEYKASSNKLGTYKISEATAIIDATNVPSAATNVDSGNYTVSQIAAGSLSTFVDGEAYSAVVAAKEDGVYQFAVVLTGNDSIRLETGFAVIDSVDKAIDEADGEVKTTITVLDESGKGELVTYYVSENVTGDTIGTPERGTVVALGLKDGVVVAYEELFTGFANVADLSFSDLATTFTGLGAGNTLAGSAGDTFFRTAGVANWDNTTSSSVNGYARVGFGMIIDKKDSEVTFATGTASANYASNGVALTKATGEKTFDIADDVNVYVVDNNYLDKTGSGRISVGSTGSIMKTATVKEVMSYTQSGSGTESDPYQYVTEAGDVISVTNVPNGEANYAYFKVVDGDITDIVVFVPAV